MDLRVQKRIAADILKCSPKRVVISTEKPEDIKESITKADIRGLIIDKIITRKQKIGVARAKAELKRQKKRHGRRRGPGSRKGRTDARMDIKRSWINTIRLQRQFLKHLRDEHKIEKETYRDLYHKAKGGFFRSKRHLTVYIEERNLMKK